MTSGPALFDDDSALEGIAHPLWSGIRLPDGRAVSWAEYGSPLGLPCLLIPDRGSSRLAPGWLLHDSALPAAIRLLSVDRPGTGHSDPVGLGSSADLATDLESMIATLAIGRVGVVGVGAGADDALDLAARRPDLVGAVGAVSVRLGAAREDLPGRRWFRRHRWAPAAPVAGWAAALGDGDPLDESAWSAAVDRMTTRHRQLLGSRWLEEDFRIAVAADLAEQNSEWAGVDSPETPRQWRTDLARTGVPVQFWHGTHDGPTTLRDLQDLASGAAGWTVTTVSGTTAMFGCWPQILVGATRQVGIAA